ncbi:MAG: hypothetical protein COS88_01820 [Chloroflexi bacterium CG07_land_8_20_14_0_80_51_10]|nr:MAG: hypothetical protein COS88_01820 [Chloroflexi bacterium CG07_land_8_20_14_0_80_51_10]
MKDERIYYHVVFTVYRGQKALWEDIESYLHELVGEIAKKWNYSIIEMETMPDHVHLLLEKPPWEDLPKIIKNIKGTTARKIFERFPDLRLDMKSNHLWTKGYKYVKHDSTSLPTVIKYIREQKQKGGLGE